MTELARHGTRLPVRPISLWLALGGPHKLDGVRVEPVEEAASPFDLLDAARALGAADLREVGALCASASQIELARRAGLGAVVGVASDETAAAELLAAEPDSVATADGLAKLDGRRFGAGARARILLNPGPGLTTQGVKHAAIAADICHREEEYVALDHRIRERLLQLAAAPDGWRVALFSGSGTAANEAAVRALVRRGRRLAVVVNGVYGERIHEMAGRAGIETVPIEASWTEPIRGAEVAELLAGAGDVDALAVVHHETTTGLLNPLAEIAAAAQVAGALVLVDAISSFGAEELSLAGLDVVTCTSNKCLHGLAGASFAFVSPAAGTRLAEVEPTSVYLDLRAQLDAGASGSPPFTPAVPALRSLDQALDEVFALGFAEHRRRYAGRAELLDEILDRLGLVQLLPPEHRSRSIRSVALPEGRSFASLHAPLRDEGYVVYAGQGPLARTIFRIACIGALRDDDLRGFGEALERALMVDAA